MSAIAFLLALFNGFKTCLPVFLTVVSGLVMILTKTVGFGISELFQALTFIFGGVSLVGFKKAVAEVSTLLGQGQTTGTSTGQTTGTSTGQPVKMKAKAKKAN